MVHSNPRPVNTVKCQEGDTGGDRHSEVGSTYLVLLALLRSFKTRYFSVQGCRGALMDVASRELVIIVGLALGSCVVQLAIIAVNIFITC